MKKDAEEAKKKSDLFTQLDKRNVVEEYKASSEEADIIIISGYEIGRYWLIEEALTGNVESEDEENEEDRGNDRLFECDRIRNYPHTRKIGQ